MRKARMMRLSATLCADVTSSNAMRPSMPAVTDLNDLFVEMLKDIYYAEKKILKALPKMAKAVGQDSELAEAFETHREETEGQIQRLEEVFQLIGSKAKGKKCEAIEGLNKEAEEAIEEIEDQATLEAALLASAQAVEHYEIARYGTLVEWAKVLGHDDAVELLEETLEEEKKTDELLNEMAINSINERAARGGEDDEEEEDAEASSDEDEEEEPARAPAKRRRAA
jgi:ferritin-like metal-binding protein YciE